MAIPYPKPEPTPRDEKKLRRTAYILVLIMIFGGGFILFAYSKLTKGKAGDDRPAIIYRITPERDLRMLRQDGRTADLVDLRGNVIAVHVVSLDNPKPAELSRAVMKRISQSQAGEPKFSLVTLLIDPTKPEELAQKLSTFAADMGASLPQWWVGSNEPKTLHKFIKNELKASIYPNNLKGEWEYDSSIYLIDKNGHLRRAVVPQKQGGPPFIATFDFEQAAAWDQRAVKTGNSRSNVEQLEFLLIETVDKLLAEKLEKS